MKIVGWLLIVGGAGFWLWRKYGAASPADQPAGGDSPSYVFNGQVGSNFYDNSVIASESQASPINNLRATPYPGHMQWAWEDENGKTHYSTTKPSL